MLDETYAERQYIGEMYDVLVVGAGVVGCAAARELTRYDIRVGVLEAMPDVSLGTSCRNSGVIHSGINYKPGTARAALSVLGNSMMDDLCAELKVPIKRIGKLTVALAGEDLPGLRRQHEQGLANGVPGMELMDSQAMRGIQPGVEGILGLWTPSSGIISPYGLTIALAENALANGADFYFGHRADGARRREDGIFEVDARREPDGALRRFSARVLVNSAGLRSYELTRTLGIDCGAIWACRGEYYVLDRRLDGVLKTLIYPVPGPNDPGLGIHLTPTVDGNILIGPSAAYIPDEDREDYRATAPVMEDLRREGLRLLPNLDASDFIRSFSGNRPKQTPPEEGGNADFTIDDESMPGFIRLQGIESPGLTSSPAIAVRVREMVGKHAALRKRQGFTAERPGFAGPFSALPKEVRMDMIRDEPEYGEIVCRCEGVTKAEVRRAIENPLGARAIASVKYRSRAMMGRCQGGFCLPRIIRMLRDEYGYGPDDYILREWNSRMFSGSARRPRGEGLAPL